MYEIWVGFLNFFIDIFNLFFFLWGFLLVIVDLFSPWFQGFNLDASLVVSFSDSDLSLIL